MTSSINCSFNYKLNIFYNYKSKNYMHYQIIKIKLENIKCINYNVQCKF